MITHDKIEHTESVKTFLPIKSDSFSVRLAETDKEIEAAQQLRYRVFYHEMGAKPSLEMQKIARDFDDFDDDCDHLLVLYHDDHHINKVVGTYRLLRRDTSKFKSFYSASEYDLSKINAFPGKILELGRSCVDTEFRSRMTMQILWRGIAHYVFLHNIDLMFGCASLPGINLNELRIPLSYLHHYCLAPEMIRTKALNHHYVSMNMMSKDEIISQDAITTLPPLIKGYLRLGGFVGDGAVVDQQFNTTDVCILVKTDLITSKYFRHYDRTARNN